MHAGASEIDDCLRARDQTNASVRAGGSRKSAQFHGTHFSASNPFSEIGVPMVLGVRDRDVTPLCAIPMPRTYWKVARISERFARISPERVAASFDSLAAHHTSKRFDTPARELGEINESPARDDDRVHRRAGVECRFEPGQDHSAGRRAGARPATVERITIHGKALEGNLEGDAVDRPVLVVLPPSYS
jgi:hypothetical protein